MVTGDREDIADPVVLQRITQLRVTAIDLVRGHPPGLHPGSQSVEDRLPREHRLRLNTVPSGIPAAAHRSASAHHALCGKYNLRSINALCLTRCRPSPCTWLSHAPSTTTTPPHLHPSASNAPILTGLPGWETHQEPAQMVPAFTAIRLTS